MTKNYQEKLVGVFGDPVEDNPTVVLEQAAFDAYHLPFRYLTIKVRKAELAGAIQGLRAMNFSGINITMPHKTEVLQYLDEVADDAKLMGAVNTIYWKNGKLRGENTDGKGFMKSLIDGGITISGKKAIVLGAGGVARAISVELSNAGISEITIVNISREHGEELVKLLNDNTSAQGSFVLWNETYEIPSDTDIVVNATPIGFSDPNQFPDINYDSLTSSMVVCDVIPNTQKTLFLEKAQQIGCKTFNGLIMLVNQGALAFELWTGKKAPVDIMTEALKNEILN